MAINCARCCSRRGCSVTRALPGGGPTRAPREAPRTSQGVPLETRVQRGRDWVSPAGITEQVRERFPERTNKPTPAGEPKPAKRRSPGRAFQRKKQVSRCSSGKVFWHIPARRSVWLEHSDTIWFSFLNDHSVCHVGQRQKDGDEKKGLEDSGFN